MDRADTGRLHHHHTVPRSPDRVAVAFERLGGPRIGVALRLAFTAIVYLVFVAVWIAPAQQKLVGLLAALFSIIEAWRRCYIYAHFTRMA